MNLAEKYRPRSLGDVVGQPKAVARLRGMLDRGIGGNALWITGATGVGKSTLALIAARSLADDSCIHQTTGRELGPATVRELARTMYQYGLGAGSGKGGRAVVVNEAHGLSAPAIEVLLEVLEAVPAHGLWVFTTTKDGQAAFEDGKADARPLMHRCAPITLTNQGLADAFAPWLRGIAQTEGLDGQPVEAYIKLMREVNNSPRAALHRIAAGCMAGGGE